MLLQKNDYCLIIPWKTKPGQLHQVHNILNIKASNIGTPKEENKHNMPKKMREKQNKIKLTVPSKSICRSPTGVL